MNHTNGNTFFNASENKFLKAAVYLLGAVYFFVAAGRFHGSLFGISFTTGYDAFKLIPFPFVAWGIWRYRQKQRPWFSSPLLLPFVLVFLCSFVSGVASPSPWQALADSLEILFYLGLFVILSDIPWTPELLRVPAMGFVFGNLYLISAAVRQYLSAHGAGGAVRISGTFTHPNELGAYSILGLTLLAWIALRTKSQLYSLWTWIAAGGICFCAIASQSRTAMLALLIWATCVIYASKPQYRKKLGYAFAALVFASILIYPQMYGRFLALGREIPNPNQVNRPLIWQTYLSNELPAQSPFGIGLGPVSLYRFGDFIASSPDSPTLTRAWGPHNTYLQWLVGSGFIGLFFLLWLLKSSWDRIQHSPHAERTILSAGLLSFLFICLAQEPFLRTNIPIAWITLTVIGDRVARAEEEGVE